MSKLYWTRDIKEILDNKIDGTMRTLLADKKATDQDIVNVVRATRTLRMFCDEIIAEMEEMDRQEDEARKGGS